MSLLRAPSTACQSTPACMFARSSAYAYFLEIVVGKWEVQMLKRRGAKTDPCATPFWDVVNCFVCFYRWLRVKLQLPIISMIMRNMCLTGSNRSNLRRDTTQCRRLLWDRQTQLQPSQPRCLASAKWPDLRSTSRVENQPVPEGVMDR